MSRIPLLPKVGDRVIHVSGHGDYTCCALIEKIEGGACSVCLDPSVPFILATSFDLDCSIYPLFNDLITFT